MLGCKGLNTTSVTELFIFCQFFMENGVCHTSLTQAHLVELTAHFYLALKGAQTNSRKTPTISTGGA